MSTKLKDTETPPDIREEFEAVLEHIRTGKVLDAGRSRRIGERAEKIRERILREQGLQDIGVQIIRELRGELPEP